MGKNKWIKMILKKNIRLEGDKNGTKEEYKIGRRLNYGNRRFFIWET